MVGSKPRFPSNEDGPTRAWHTRSGKESWLEAHLVQVFHNGLVHDNPARPGPRLPSEDLRVVTCVIQPIVIESTLRVEQEGSHGSEQQHG